MSITLYMRIDTAMVEEDQARISATVEIFNQSNTNFRRLCDLVGLPFDYDGDIAGLALIDLQDNINIVHDALLHMPELDGGVPHSVEIGALGCIEINCGLRAGYWREKFDRLKPLVDRAVASGGSIYWC